MCGIAGLIDLRGERRIPGRTLRRMADAIVHRGPDEDGFLDSEPGIGLANRRLSIVGLADGKQPISNEDGSVVVVFNGEFFDYPEVKAQLQAKGHVFRTHCDTEIIPHLWEEYGEGMFAHLRGQFALALWDRRQRRLILARDRFGICPLFWARTTLDGTDWLLFGSEIKAILASAMIEARPDVRGIDQVFNFFAVPGVPTCFAGVSTLQPGHFLTLQFGVSGQLATITDRPYWEMEFPDRGHERDSDDPKALVDEFERVFTGAVERRLRADVPVVSYLSGGIDSSIVVAAACKIRGTPIPTFTIQIKHPKLDETSQAAVMSRYIGSDPVVVSVGDAEVLEHYPELIRAAEAPVIDTSCTALLMLARSVHQHGYKVALTGEGSDEWLAGYVWYKVHKWFTLLDFSPRLKFSNLVRRGVMKLIGAPPGTTRMIDQVRAKLGEFTAFQEMYGFMGQSRLRFFSEATLQSIGDTLPYEYLSPDYAKINRWHPLNQSLYWAGRIHLPGHLLSLKGDRIAMNSSVETRYPFLDEEVFDFLAKLHPRWKMRGMQDKYILRLLGERMMPREVAWRKKGMFRAPLDSFFSRSVPKFFEQLLSEESLRRTGYFNVQAVRFWLEKARNRQLGRLQRTSIELGLVGVVTTQLWHHLFIDGSLAELPSDARATPSRMDAD
jgi:asparagine synthase (glutamine-hydrolysing)